MLTRQSGPERKLDQARAARQGWLAGCGTPKESSIMDSKGNCFLANTRLGGPKTFRRFSGELYMLPEFPPIEEQ